MSERRTITCPVCGMTSGNPHDVLEGYCGNCHDWTSPPAIARMGSDEILRLGAETGFDLTTVRRALRDLREDR